MISVYVKPCWELTEIFVVQISSVYVGLNKYAVE
jgi:hypothetical protein